MKESLSSKLYNYLQEKGVWINGGELERLAGEWGFKASNAGKRLREMSSNKHKDNDYKEPVLYKESRPKINSKGETIWYRAIDIPVKVSTNQFQGIPRIFTEGRKEELSGQMKLI